MGKTVVKIGMDDFLSEVYSEVVRTQCMVHALIQEIAKLRSRETGEDVGKVSREILDLAEINFSRIVNKFYDRALIPHEGESSETE